MILFCLQCNCSLTLDDLGRASRRPTWEDSFCSIRCRKKFFSTKLTNRICSRDGCNRRVPEKNRLLCKECFHNGDSLTEPIARFGESDNLRLEQGSEAARLRLAAKVRVYSARNMTQEELRSLVPSLREKARRKPEGGLE